MKVKTLLRSPFDWVFFTPLSAVLLGALVLVPCARPQTPSSGVVREAGQLIPHQPVERELGPGQTDVFNVDLAAQQFLHVIVEQKGGIDVVLAIENAAGKILFTADTPLRAQPASLVADQPGVYRITVSKSPRTTETGRYRIELTDLRSPTKVDLTRVEAEREFFTATVEQHAPNKESRLSAIDRFQRAASLWHSLNDSYWEATTLVRIGAGYLDLGENQKALDYYKQALPLRHALGDRQGEAGILSNIGIMYRILGENQQALDYFNQALPLARALGDRSNEADTLNNIGILYQNLGQQQKALDHFNQALPLDRALGDREGEADALNNIGTVYRTLGEKQKAVDSFNQALPLERALGDRFNEEHTLSNLGDVYLDLGESQKALDHYNLALALMRELGDRAGEAVGLANLGLAYRDLGDNQKALDYYNRALLIERASGNRREEARQLGNIGLLYLELREKQKALEHFEQALPLWRNVGDRLNEARGLNYIGAAHMDFGDNKQALDYYNQALTLNREVADRDGEGDTLKNLGRVYVKLADSRRALEYFNQALSIEVAIQDRRDEGMTLYEMARVERDRGELAQAGTLASNARDIVESLRTKVINEDLRASYFASVQDYYELEMDVLMRLHRADPSRNYQADALHAAERARARTLLETLSEARADIREGVDPRVLERERALQAQLNASELTRMRTLGAKHTTEQATEVDDVVRDLTSQYEEVRAQIRSQSPRYAALTFPQPLKLDEIQKEVLDADTLLLEYALGDQQSFLWVVSSSGIASAILPKRSDVEQAARSFYDDLTKPEISSAPEGGKVLSRMLLGDVASSLGNKRLLIVADGALQYLPFAALPDPGGFQQPLIVNHEIVSVPSASTLALLRRENMNRKPAPKTLAILADPVFSRDDSRIGGGQQKNAVAVRDADEPLSRSLSDVGLNGPHLPRLPGTRREAAGIISLLPEGERKQALDFEASRATLMSPEIGQYRILHLATHGLLNSAHPELSGIVLSLVDRQGQPQNGFLRLNEVYNLKLSADLVVLSACQTALGKEIRGEGLVGLTRGFMYAGAPRVLASLWKVDDRATAELMKQFYGAMLKGTGQRPAEALRAAQIAMWKTKGWEAPYYWGAFVLQGDWK